MKTPTSSRLFLTSVIALITLFSHTPVSVGADTYYTGANGDWTTALDWTNGQPGTADRGNVNNRLTVNITTDVGTINALRVGTAGNSTDGEGTIIIDGGVLTIADGGGTGADVTIGSGAFKGTLRIINGGTLTSNNAGADGEIYIGQNNGSDGILLLDNGTINANRAFYVADGTGSTGTVTIGDGTGTADAILNTQGGNLEVGNDGNGTMTVNSDGVVNINSNNLVIGQTGSSNGHVIVDGGTININATGDINMNSGTSFFTLNSGSVLGLRNFNQSSLEGTPSVSNFNGGLITTSGDIVDRNGLSTLNYNGTQMQIGGGDLSTTTMNVGTAAAGGAVTMNIVGTGLSSGLNGVEADTVIVYRGLNISSPGIDATINVNNGFLEVRRGIAGGGGTSTLNVGSMGTAGQLFIEGVNPLVDVSSQISSLNVGANGTLSARPNLFNVNPIDTAAANLTDGTLTIDNSLITSAASNSQNFETIWVGGSTEWDGTATQWSRGLPSGYTINSDTQMTVVNSASPIIGSVNLITAGWTLVDDGTTTGTLIVKNDAQINAGATRAVLRGTAAADANVVRATDLIISNNNAAGFIGATDAAHLEIMDNATLTVGTPTVNANVYVGGASNGTVDQNGSMTINGNLYFGQNPAGGDNGGTWNLGAGESLTVTGSIEERDASTNSAQFYIRGGTLDVAGDITVQRLDLADGTSQNSTLNIKPGQTVTSTGTTQIGRNSAGIINVTDATSVLQAANMTIGGGNANNSRLNVTAGIGGTFGGGLTFGNNAGANSGPELLVSGTGIVRVSNNGNIQNAASGNADLLVNSGSTNDIRVTEQGLLDIARDFSLHNNTTAGHRLNVLLDDTATINVGRNLDFRSGTTNFDVQGGTLAIGGDLLLNAGTGTFRVEGASSTITVGGAITVDAGQTLTFALDGSGLSPIVATSSTASVTVNGDINVDTSLLSDPVASADALTTWSSGSGAWTATDTEWISAGGFMLNPDGAGFLTSGSRITAISVPNDPFFGGVAGTPTVLTPDWSFDPTTDVTKGDLVYTGADVDSLPLHAVLSDNGGAITITRSTDLQIAPVLGNAASAMTVNADVTLNVSDGVLDGSGPNLVLGSATAIGTATQNGGAVHIDGNLVFGTGASSFGGTYDLFGGLLMVHGDIVEGSVGGGLDSTVTDAQLHVDGGTLNLVGSNLSTQSLRVGNAAGRTGSLTLTDKTVNNSGTLYVAESGTGTLNLLGTTTLGDAASVSIQIGESTASDGTLNIGDGTDTPVVNASNIDVAVSGTGALTILSGTINATGGINLADGGGGSGTMVVGNGTSAPIINNSGGNFETADVGTGVVTWNSGTLNQTTNNLIVGQGAGSNATFILNDGLIDLENQLRMNNGVGLVDQNGGTMNVGTTLDMENGSSSTTDMTYRISGGTLNVGDRATGDLIIGNTPNADSTSHFEQTGGTVNVNRHVYAGDPTAVMNIGYNYATPAVEDGTARLLVGWQDVGTGSTVDITRGTLNIGGGIHAGNTSGSSVALTVGSNGGIDADTTIRAGIAGVDGSGETRIGISGSATLTVESGKYFQETQNFVVANNGGSTGDVIVNGGELNVGYDQPTMTNNGASDLTFGAGTGTVTQNDGTVRVANRLVFTPVGGKGTYTAAGGTTEITGDVLLATDPAGESALNISGGSVNVGGNIDFGSNLGSDSISLTSGTLNFTQAGGGTITARNARDTFTFSGGTLQNLGVFNGYDPSASPEVANLGSTPSDAFLINGAESGFASGKVGNALTFDTNLGNNEAVSFGDDRFGNPTALTVSIWFNRSQENNGTTTNHAVNNVLVAQSSTTTNDNFEIGTQGNNLELYFDTTTGGNPAGDTLAIDLTSFGGVVDGTWNHLVFTYDQDATDGRMKIFYNGAAVTSFDQDAFNGPLASAAGTPDSPFSLGIARPGTSNWGDFSGQLDEFAAWNTAISASDVASLYNGGAGSNSSTILGSAVIYAPLEGQLAGNLETFTQTGGIFAPGLATGTLADQVGTSVINAGFEFTAGLWDFDLISNGGVQNDMIDINGTVTLGGTSTLGLTLLDWTDLSDADVFILAEYDMLTGTFGSVDFTDLISRSGLSSWMIDYNYGGANQIAVLVPEPSRAILLTMGLTLSLLRRRRKAGAR